MMFSRKRRSISPLLCLSLVGACLLTGCTTVRETLPEETATHQALIGYAAIASVDAIKLPDLKQRRVWVDASYLEAYHESFVVGQFRKRLATMGAVLVEDADESELIIELRAAMLSTTKLERLLGLPSFSVPVPTVGTVTTPELSVLKQKKQDGIAGLAVLGIDPETRLMRFASDPVVGLTRMNDWAIFGIPVYEHRLNLPELIDEH